MNGILRGVFILKIIHRLSFKMKKRYRLVSIKKGIIKVKKIRGCGRINRMVIRNSRVINGMVVVNRVKLRRRIKGQKRTMTLVWMRKWKSIKHKSKNMKGNFKLRGKRLRIIRGNGKNLKLDKDKRQRVVIQSLGDVLLKSFSV